MLITCPGCGTNFSIPDSALGTTGRKLKCAKCAHKWHQPPLMVLDDEEDADFDLSGPSFSRSSAGAASAPPSYDPPPLRPASAMDDIRMDPPPVPDFGPRLDAERGRGDPSDSLLEDDPKPIPEVFSNPSAEGGKGTAVLWILLVLLVLAGLGGGAYYFQDRLVDAIPEAGEMLAQAGLRREKPGAGLELRKAGTPERFVLNDTDVLVLRGIIANPTDRVRPVPTMKLVLMDKSQNPVQEKLAQPPVSALDPQGTASFKITLERPDPNAVEAVVVFVDAAEAKAAPAPSRPLSPPLTPDVPAAESK